MSTKVRKSRQEKMVDSVLTKAKRFVKDLEVEDDSKKADQSGEQDGGPPAKRRKPRHASEEGKRLLEARAKANGDNPKTSSTPEKSSKKKKKKKGKNKKTASVKATSGGEAGAGESSDRLRMEALSYLQLWKSHRNVWKFEKLKQLWLLKHAVNEAMIGDNLFPMLLEYIGSVVGVAKIKTLQGSQSVMAEFEGKYGKLEANKALDAEKKAYERARQIVQMLS